MHLSVYKIFKYVIYNNSVYIIQKKIKKIYFWIKKEPLRLSSIEIVLRILFLINLKLIIDCINLITLLTLLIFDILLNKPFASLYCIIHAYNKSKKNIKKKDSLETINWNIVLSVLSISISLLILTLAKVYISIIYLILALIPSQVLGRYIILLWAKSDKASALIRVYTYALNLIYTRMIIHQKLIMLTELHLYLITEPIPISDQPYFYWKVLWNNVIIGGIKFIITLPKRLYTLPKRLKIRSKNNDTKK